MALLQRETPQDGIFLSRLVRHNSLQPGLCGGLNHSGILHLFGLEQLFDQLAALLSEGSFDFSPPLRFERAEVYHSVVSCEYLLPRVLYYDADDIEELGLPLAAGLAEDGIVECSGLSHVELVAEALVVVAPHRLSRLRVGRHHLAGATLDALHPLTLQTLLAHNY